jgi:dTDP-4-amino-4,6-dideoxygalactose transaminase
MQAVEASCPDAELIPFVDLKAQYASIKDEVAEAIRGVLESVQFVGGKQLALFEREFAAFCDVKYAMGVANGTDALHLALWALGIRNGDEVITTANTFIATAAAIAATGAQPVFVDINPQTYTIDPAMIEPAITGRTKAIIPVHLFGQSADMQPILEIARRHSLYVVEDAAQAHGAEYRGARMGSIGDIACFSFYPGKNLGAYGDGGCITTNSDRLAECVEQLRDHGRITKHEHAVVGFNSRLDTLQAAILRVKLRRLEQWNSNRQRIASWYAAELANAGVKTPSVQDGSTHVYHLYVIESEERDILQMRLATAGVSTGIHYPIPIHLQPAFAYLGYRKGDLPRSEQSAERLLSLPMFPELTPKQVSTVAELVRGHPAATDMADPVQIASYYA